MSHEIQLHSQDEIIRLFGHAGEVRKRIQELTQVRIVDRGTKIVVVGEEDECRIVDTVLTELLERVQHGYSPTAADAAYLIEELRQPGFGVKTAGKGSLIRQDIHVRPRTRGQRHYLDSIQQCELTLVIGPAGTGKTYLAMATAVSALLNKRVKRLVLTRPAVEAGESLGFLPGDLEQKVNPYLRPLYDALYSMVDVDRAQRMVDENRIEVAPLAFMRGRTLDQSFVILDEAQNTTRDQMLMFLTRLGQGSHAVVTGDITQVDLPKGKVSGLVEAKRILEGVEGVAIVQLTRHDVVRNALVQRIIDAYEAEEPDTAQPSVQPDKGASGL